MDSELADVIESILEDFEGGLKFQDLILELLKYQSESGRKDNMRHTLFRNIPDMDILLATHQAIIDSDKFGILDYGAIGGKKFVYIIEVLHHND